MRRISFLLVFFIFCSMYGFNQDYYVDYENGKDSNNGLSPTTAWKHAPGDKNRVSKKATANPIQPGSNIYFKGGVVYSGSIDVLVGGEPEKRIRYIGDKWPGLEGTKAIITGTQKIDCTWQKATKQDLRGNLNWDNIYYTQLDDSYNVFNVQFFDNNEKIYNSQDPNISDPFWDDRFSEYNTIAVKDLTHTSLKDENYFTQSDKDFYKNTYVLIWCNPNIIIIREIESYNPETHTISYEALPETAIYSNREYQYYSIMNHPYFVDKEGEYSIDPENKRLYYWPKSNIDNIILTASNQSQAFDTRGLSNLSFEGLTIYGYTNEAYAAGIKNSKTWGEASENITIRNCEFYGIRTKNGKKGAISMSNVNNLLVEDNYIHHNQRNSGLLLGVTNSIIRNNIIDKNGYKGIWLMGCKKVQLLDNTISRIDGTHSSGISVFDSENILTARNEIFNCGGLFSFEDDHNIIFHNNLLYFDEEHGGDVIRDNHGKNTGYIIITNNTALRSYKNIAIAVGYPNEDSKTNIIVKNNIIDGWGSYAMQCDASHNLYTGLSWSQKPRYDWSLQTEEYLEKDLSQIFTDSENHDYSLLENSLAIEKGINVNDILPEEIKNLFPDFDYNLDIRGKTRPENKKWDFGALSSYNIHTGIKNCVLASEKVKVFPNPAINEILINTNSAVQFPLKVDIINMAGQKVFSQYLYSQNEKITVKQLIKGVYILNITNNTNYQAHSKLFID